MSRTTMAVSSVLNFGQWGYPIQSLGSYGRAEEKIPRIMLFTSEHLLVDFRKAFYKKEYGSLI